MRTSFLFLCFLLISYYSFGQYLDGVQYVFNPYMINPSFSAYEGKVSANIYGKFLLSGSESYDQSTIPNPYLSFEVPVNSIQSVFGATIIKADNSFIVSSYKYAFNYQFNYQVKTIKLRIGGNLAYKNEAIDFTKYRISDPDDPLIESKVSKGWIDFDVGFGVSHQNFDLGFAALNLAQRKIDFGAESLQWIQDVLFETFVQYTYSFDDALALKGIARNRSTSDEGLELEHSEIGVLGKYRFLWIGAGYSGIYDGPFFVTQVGSKDFFHLNVNAGILGENNSSNHFVGAKSSVALEVSLQLFFGRN